MSGFSLACEARRAVLGMFSSPVTHLWHRGEAIPFESCCMWHLLGMPGSSSPVMVPAGTISKDYSSYIFDGKMGFDGILEDIAFYV